MTTSLPRLLLFFSLVALVAGSTPTGRCLAQVAAMPMSVAPGTYPIPDVVYDAAVVDIQECPVHGMRGEAWSWQILPTGLMYPTYLAGSRQSRLGAQWGREKNLGHIWDLAIGGKVGVLRYGTSNTILPQGVQIDLEAAAFPRITANSARDLISTDFRAGVPISLRQDCWETTIGYFHTSSHVGDDYLANNPMAVPVNYVRDEIVWACAFRPYDDLRFYAETGWAFNTDGGAKPWAFQFGVDLSSVRPSGAFGSPFLAVNSRLREPNLSGSITAQTGWQWRGTDGHLLRTGISYFNGLSDSGQTYNVFEEQFALGLWYDF